MNKTGILLPGKEWKVLDREQVKIIDQAAYAILNQVGAFIDDLELLKMAQQMGAEVNFEKKIAKGFPEDVIKGSVAKAPKNFVLAGRDPAWDLIIDGPGRQQFWGASSGATDRIYHNEQGKPYRRRANKDDVAYTARIIDGIDDFDWDGYLFDTAEEGQLGLPSELIRLDTMLKNTSKFTGNVCTTVSDIREYDYPTLVTPAGYMKARRESLRF
ncbi:MAG: trimethylamine methyltransferase family protein [Candidatus Methanomethylicia archaeon]|jgi:trimethylamine:corrinoid methyltransferase-like protein|nr:trimethylamine methyltransferase family protein [Candidatus Methanomethylicia archaeon]